MSCYNKLLLLLITAGATNLFGLGLGQNATTSTHQWNNTSVFILVLNSSVESCHTDVINSAVWEAVNAVNLNTLQTVTINTTNMSCPDCQEAQNAFFSALLKKPNEMAIIGPTCSSVSDSIAQIAHHYQIPMMSLAPYHSESEYFFTIVPSLTVLMNGIVQFIEAFPEWQRLSIISQDAEVFRKVAVYLEQTLANKTNVSVSSSTVVSRAISYTDIDVYKLLENSTRIIVLNMNSSATRALLCKASSTIQHLYVWIVPTSLHETWWLSSDNESCPDAQLHLFLNKQGILLVKGSLDYNSSLTRYSLPQLNLTQSASVLTSLVYDSVVSIALALNATASTNLTQLEDDISQSPARIRTVGKVLSQNINKTAFQGYSGRVSFDDGHRLVDVQVFQFRRRAQPTVMTQLVEVGVIQQGREIRFNKSRESVWLDGIPSDGRTVTEVNYPLLALTIATYIGAGCNILIAIAGMLFMGIFRKRRVIRLSSPNLNYLVGMGVIILSAATFMFVYPPLPKSTVNIFCAIRPWFTSLGYSLCLGTINTKMWRVYYICRNAKATAKKKPIKDWHLFLFVGLFVIVDVIILTLSTSFQSSRQQATIIPDVEHKEGGVNENGIEVEFQVIACESRYRLHWLGPLLGYKIVYHIVAVFLAFKIRKVKVKVLNDSKEVALVLYLTGLLLLTVIVITIAFRSYLNVYAGTYAVGICLTGAVVLIVVFVSKAIYLYKDPTGKEVFPTTHNNVNTAVSVAHPPTEVTDIIELQRKVRTLEAQLTTIEEANCLQNENAVNDSELNMKNK